MLRTNRRDGLGKLAFPVVAGVLVGIVCTAVMGAFVVGRSAIILALSQGGGPSPSARPLPAKHATVAFMTHRKTGVALTQQILKEAASLLGAPISIQVQGGLCHPGALMTVANVDRAKYERMVSHCPGLRSVHVVRRPSARLVSDYIYVRKLHLYANREAPSLNRFGEELRDNGSVEWGLERVCRFHVDGVGGRSPEDMLDVRDATREDPRVLEVKLEDLEADFDHWTRAMFEHMFGRGSPHIDKLVSRASRHDVSRMRVPDIYHVSNTTTKKEVSAVLRSMYRRGASECLRRVKRLETDLGYRWDLGPAPAGLLLL